jgi:IS66 Orf2 like protein
VLVLGNGWRIASGWNFGESRVGATHPHCRGGVVMFGLGPATKIYLGAEAVDIRKGFEGLYGLVRDHLGQDPLSGHLFLFTNRTRNQTRFCISSTVWP